MKKNYIPLNCIITFEDVIKGENNEFNDELKNNLEILNETITPSFLTHTNSLMNDINKDEDDDIEDYETDNYITKKEKNRKRLILAIIILSIFTIINFLILITKYKHLT